MNESRLDILARIAGKWTARVLIFSAASVLFCLIFKAICL